MDEKTQKLVQDMWLSLARKDVVRAQRSMKQGSLAVISNARVLARACQKEFNKQVLRSQKLERDTPNRCRKLMREVMTYWLAACPATDNN